MHHSRTGGNSVIVEIKVTYFGGENGGGKRREMRKKSRGNMERNVVLPHIVFYFQDGREMKRTYYDYRRTIVLG